jgi:hypothetical protein
MSDNNNKSSFLSWPAALIYCCLFIHCLIFTQIKTISDQAIDRNSKEQLPCANMIIKGTKISTQTNLEGFFLPRKLSTLT